MGSLNGIEEFQEKQACKAQIFLQDVGPSMQDVQTAYRIFFTSSRHKQIFRWNCLKMAPLVWYITRAETIG